MDYIKSKFINGSYLYSITQYFSYSGDGTKVNNKQENIFKLIDDMYQNENVLDTVVELLISLYKEELLFKFKNISKHDYIVSVPYENEKFNYINNTIVNKLATSLFIEVDNNFFNNNCIKNVDIRDYYTNDNVKELKFDLNFDRKSNYIIFDFIVSTGFILKYVSDKTKALSNCLFMSYSVRQDVSLLNNYKIEYSKMISNSTEHSEEDDFGYIIHIKNLFGEKDVTVDLSQNPNIIIGENGLGKSNAVKIALLSVELFKNKDSWNSDEYTNNIKKMLSYFKFESVEIIRKIPLYEFTTKTIEFKKEDLSDKKIFKNKRFHSIKDDLAKFKPGTKVVSNSFGNGIIHNNNLNIEKYTVDIEFESIVKSLDYESFELESKNDSKLNRVYLYVDSKLLEVAIIEDNEVIESKNLDLTTYIWYVNGKYFNIQNSINEDMVLIGEKLYKDVTIKTDSFESIYHYEPSMNKGEKVNYEKSKEYINYNLLPKLEEVDIEKLLYFFNENNLHDKVVYQTFLEYVQYYYLEKEFHNSIKQNLHTHCFNLGYIDLIPCKELNTCELIRNISQDEYSTLYQMIIIDDYSIYDEIESLVFKYGSKECIDKIYNSLKAAVVKSNDLYSSNFYLKDCNTLFLNSALHRTIKPYLSENMFELLNINSNYNDYFNDEFSKINSNINYDDADLYDNCAHLFYDRDEDIFFDIDGNRCEPEDFEWDTMVECEEISKTIALRSKAQSISKMYPVEQQLIKEMKECCSILRIEYNSIDFCEDNLLELDEFVGYISFNDITQNLLNYVASTNEIKIHKILGTYFNNAVINFIFKFCGYYLENSLLEKAPGYKYIEEEMNICKIDNISKLFMKFLNQFLIDSTVSNDKKYNFIFKDNKEVFKFGLLNMIRTIDSKLYENIKTISDELINYVDFTAEQSKKLDIIYKMLSFYIEILNNEKLLNLTKKINKYLCGKEVCIFTNCLMIKNNGKVIPMHRLSTGEVNVILNLLITEFSNNSTLVFDELDVSLSIKWQSMIIKDMMCNDNKIVVLTQSPSLIRQNGLKGYISYLNGNFEYELDVLKSKHLNNPQNILLTKTNKIAALGDIESNDIKIEGDDDNEFLPF